MTSYPRVIQEVLEGMFPDSVWDDSAEATANRILRFWKEFVPDEKVPFSFTTFDAGDYGGQMIIVKDIEFSSLCAHHLLPFIGTAYVGYIPHLRMVGLSKIPRLVHHYAKGPQTQERMTHQIASHLKNATEAKGVAVVIEAKHTCMACRGVRQHNGAMVTSEMRGVFLTSPAPRAEFFAATNIGG